MGDKGKIQQDASSVYTNLPFLQTAEHDRHLTQTNMKIDTEVAGLKTMLESHKLDTIKYLAGKSCGTIFDLFISEKVMCLLDRSYLIAVLKYISFLKN